MEMSLMHISKSPVVSQGESWAQADPAQCSRTHSNDLAGQVPLCDISASEDGGSLCVTLPIRAGKGWSWEILVHWREEDGWQLVFDKEYDARWQQSVQERRKEQYNHRGQVETALWQGFPKNLCEQFSGAENEGKHNVKRTKILLCKTWETLCMLIVCQKWQEHPRLMLLCTVAPDTVCYRHVPVPRIYKSHRPYKASSCAVLSLYLHRCSLS